MFADSRYYCSINGAMSLRVLFYVIFLLTIWILSTDGAVIPRALKQTESGEGDTEDDKDDSEQVAEGDSQRKGHHEGKKHKTKHRKHYESEEKSDSNEPSPDDEQNDGNEETNNEDDDDEDSPKHPPLNPEQRDMLAKILSILVRKALLSKLGHNNGTGEIGGPEGASSLFRLPSSNFGKNRVQPSSFLDGGGDIGESYGTNPHDDM